MTRMKYTKGGETVEMELEGDSFEVCNAAAARLGLKLIEIDPEFDGVMKIRKEREAKNLPNR